MVSSFVTTAEVQLSPLHFYSLEYHCTLSLTDFTAHEPNKSENGKPYKIHCYGHF